MRLLSKDWTRKLQWDDHKTRVLREPLGEKVLQKEKGVGAEMNDEKSPAVNTLYPTTVTP